MSETPRKLILDPLLPWDGEHPYRHLAVRLEALGKPPVGPGSTMAEIRDCYYDLMAPGSDRTADRRAWDELRKVGSRLLADFFLYEVAEVDAPAALERMAAVEMPVELPDFRRLAEIPVDFAAALDPAERIEAAARPGPVELPAAVREPPPLDLGPLPPPLADYLDDEAVEQGDGEEGAR
jgi:hypothetical protein